MFNHELFAAAFARAVDVMRQSDDKEQQKGALRALVAISAGSSATLRCYDGQLSIDDVGIADSLQHVPVLITRMSAHGVSEISVGRGAEPAELLALLRGLADSSTSQSIKDRLREAQSSRIQVMLAAGRRPSSARASVSDIMDAPASPGMRGKLSAAKREEEEALAAWHDMHSLGGNTSAMKEVDLGFTTEDLDAPPPPPPPPEPEPEPEVELPIPTDTPLGQALLAVARRPRNSGILDRLGLLAAAVEKALTEDQSGAVIRALAVISRFESQAPEGTTRNSYRITLKRILSRETLEGLAPFTTDAVLAGDAAEVFAHAGSDGTEVLLGLLAGSESIRERKGYMAALRGNPHGRNQIVAMLGHPQWFVARNVAELAGEMRMEEAVDELDKLIGHADSRVRKAAVTALSKIATPAVTERMLAALRTGAPDVRAFIATLIGSAHAAAFTMPIVAQLESEADPDVLRELCLALARIGSREAVQALEEARKKGGMFNRRARILKEAAELALQRGRRTPGA
jgi:HEAT repeat protein